MIIGNESLKELFPNFEDCIKENVPVATREQSGVLCFHSR